MRRTIALAIAVMMLAGTAWADLGSLTGWNGWEGVTELKAEKVSIPGTYLWADVEWVVEWDSGVGKFHYVYQITSKGDYAVTLLGVPMLSSNEAENIGSYLVEVGDIVPQSADFTPVSPAEPTLASWSFAGLSAGQVSYGLDYWSVNMPLALGGYIQDGGVFSVSGDIPSPSNDIPEPATVALLALGAAGLLARRRKR